MDRPTLHLLLHFLVPLMICLWWFKDKWRRPFLIMIATMAIDLDHLLADPIYNPNRNSIGFHPLHTWWAIVVYLTLLWPRKTRILATGLMVHIALDFIDGLFM